MYIASIIASLLLAATAEGPLPLPPPLKQCRCPAGYPYHQSAACCIRILRSDQIYALPGTVTRPIAATDLTVGDTIIDGDVRWKVERVEITNASAESDRMIDFWIEGGKRCNVHPRGTLLVERDV